MQHHPIYSLPLLLAIYCLHPIYVSSKSICILASPICHLLKYCNIWAQCNQYTTDNKKSYIVDSNTRHIQCVYILVCPIYETNIQLVTKVIYCQFQYMTYSLCLHIGLSNIWLYPISHLFKYCSIWA